MLRVVMFGTVLLTNLSTASKADILNCGQAPDLAAARLRWAAVRQTRVDPVDNERNCRVFSVNLHL